MIERRGFLLGGASLLASCFSGLGAVANTQPVNGGWVSGYGAANNSYGVAVINPDLKITALTPTPFRLHDIVRHPNRSEYCLPARRAGTHFIVLREGQASLQIDAPHGRHFYGHGVYNHAGTRLYLTENDYDAQRGVIAVYDADNGYRLISEFDSGGIGPHQLVLDGTGNYLIVANGGILIHPASGRAKLNLDNMSPNLSLLSLATQRIEEKAGLAPDMQTLSIRHVARADDGTVYFGVQDQFPGIEDYPLVGRWLPGKPLAFLPPPENGWYSFKGYIGSITLDQSQQTLGVSSPKNGVAAFWDTRSGQALSVLKHPDICGMAPTAKARHFMISSGDGVCLNVRVGDGETTIIHQSKSSVRFDNHAIRV